MNRRIYLILIPLIALLAVLSGKDGIQHYTAPSTTCDLSKVESVRNLLPFSVNLDKDNTQRVKSKIRVKAWDETDATLHSAESVLDNTVRYFQIKFTARYASAYHSAQLYVQSLRGPPEA